MTGHPRPPLCLLISLLAALHGLQGRPFHEIDGSWSLLINDSAWGRRSPLAEVAIGKTTCLYRPPGPWVSARQTDRALPAPLLGFRGAKHIHPPALHRSGVDGGGVSRHHAATFAHSTSACSSTVCVAFSCLSGG